MNLPAIGHPSYQIPFFPFVYEKEGHDLGVLTQKHRDQYQCIRYYSQQLDPVVWGNAPCHRAIMVTTLPLEPLGKFLWDLLLTTLVPHCSGFSCCGAWALGAQVSVVVVCGLSSCGM